MRIRISKGLFKMQTPLKNRLIIRHGIIAALGIIILLVSGCDGKAKKQAVKPPPPDVAVAEVVQGKVPIVMEFSGTIKAIKTVDIIPRVSGYIEKRYFEEGTIVQQGDPLYLIDPRPYKARLDAYMAQLKLDQAALTFWEKDTKRYQTLVEQGAASKEKTEGTIAKRDEMLAKIEKDKADIENAALELSFTKIMAPFSGRTQETRINVGNLVQQQRDVLTEGGGDRNQRIAHGVAGDRAPEGDALGHGGAHVIGGQVIHQVILQQQCHQRKAADQVTGQR